MIWTQKGTIILTTTYMNYRISRLKVQLRGGVQLELHVDTYDAPSGFLAGKTGVLDSVCGVCTVCRTGPAKG